MASTMIKFSLSPELCAECQRLATFSCALDDDSGYTVYVGAFCDDHVPDHAITEAEFNRRERAKFRGAR